MLCWQGGYGVVGKKAASHYSKEMRYRKSTGKQALNQRGVFQKSGIRSEVCTHSGRLRKGGVGGSKGHF